MSERETIQFIIRQLANGLPPTEVSAALCNAGYKSAKNQSYSMAQVNSLIHSANQAIRKAQYKRIESCGIDREANPCGDASDY